MTDILWDLARLAGATLDDPRLPGIPAFEAGLPVVIPAPEIQLGGSAVTCVAWAPRHDLIATGHENGAIVLWDTSSGQEFRVLKGHEHYVRSVAFSQDGSRIASGSSDKTLRLWDASSGKELRVFTGHLGAVHSVAFWRGKSGPLLLVSSGADGTIRVWNADSGECLGILMAHGDAWAALRPGGRYRVVGDMKQYLWHVSGLARYELGELDTVYPDLKLADDEPLIPAMYFQ